MYDMGLHHGDDSVFYPAMGYQVVAFEAGPYLLALNRKRFACEVYESRLDIVEGAISDISEETVVCCRCRRFSRATTDITRAEGNGLFVTKRGGGLAASCWLECPVWFRSAAGVAADSW